MIALMTTFLGKVNWGRVAGLVLIPLALWLAIGGVYYGGKHHGEALIQNKWDAAKVQEQLQIAELKGMVAQKEAVHQQETANISSQLQKTEDDHAKAIADLSADHAQRMRQSEARAAAYRHLAEAGASQCRDLASHAAELDRSLEEGRGLVGEFQATLGQREAQLRLLGAQIVDDRKTVDGQ